MTPVKVFGRECRPPGSEPWRVTHVHVSVLYVVPDPAISVRVTSVHVTHSSYQKEIVLDWFSVPSGSAFDVDIDVVLNPGHALHLELCPETANMHCEWSVTRLAERPYPLDERQIADIQAEAARWEEITASRQRLFVDGILGPQTREALAQPPQPKPTRKIRLR